MDGQEEFEIDRIVGHKLTRQGVRFRVRWRGYDAEHDSWVRESDMGHAVELLQGYKATHSL